MAETDAGVTLQSISYFKMLSYIFTLCILLILPATLLFSMMAVTTAGDMGISF
jgi:hypothetical protein